MNIVLPAVRSCRLPSFLACVTAVMLLIAATTGNVIAQDAAPAASSPWPSTLPSTGAPAAAAPDTAVAPDTTPTTDATSAAPLPLDPGTVEAPLHSVAQAALPRDLSPWGMFMAADMVVKAVMISLVLASVLTWTIWLAKSLELSGAKRKTRKALRKLNSAGTLVEGVGRLSGARNQVAVFLDAARAELKLTAEVSDIDKDGVKERIASRLERLEAQAGRKVARGIGMLATIGAVAPFVGLFGTVWGIMNSFIGISKAQTTNLAVVAPGIAEALLATAFGLIAAIPAVMIYNFFARSIAGYRASLGDASAEVLRIVSRDLDRRSPVQSPASRVKQVAQLTRITESS